jgi:hypothetical protein
MKGEKKMMCLCRNCGKKYDDMKSRAEWAGYCSAKCQHEKAKQLGCKKSESTSFEYEVLSRSGCIGNVPADEEIPKLEAELADLQSTKSTSSRVDVLKSLLKRRK